MKAVSFMYVRPPGYNAESAKAAEISDEKMQHEGPSLDGESSSMYYCVICVLFCLINV